MKYEASDAFCKGYKLITGGSGEISSHQGAVTLNYTSKMSCKWQFVGKPGIQISAKLIYLNLASYSYYNIFALYQGSDNTRLVTIRGGNSRWPTEFLTVSNILTVVFIARQPANELGFRLQYSFVDNVEPATTSLKQASSTTARAVVSSPSSPATAKIVSDTSSAPESTTTGKLSQTEPATTSSNEASSTTARAVVSSPSSPATAKIASDTSSAPESTTTGSYWYLKADNVGNAAEKNPGEFEYDYICMKSRGDPQLNTSAAS
uniref:CUB domain-containing protein n=1 Tax=Macrostomum lignano TaxID=282301 RepID=A0A1I8G0U7_9PLAT